MIRFSLKYPLIRTLNARLGASTKKIPLTRHFGYNPNNPMQSQLAVVHNTQPTPNPLRLVVVAAVSVAHLTVFTVVIASLKDADTDATYKQCTRGLSLSDALNVTIVSLVAYGVVLCVAIPLFLQLTQKEDTVSNLGMDERRELSGLALIPFACFLTLAVISSAFSGFIDAECKRAFQNVSRWVTLDTSIYICIAMDFAWAMACIVFMILIRPQAPNNGCNGQ